MAIREDDAKLLVAQLRKRISDLEDENHRLVEQLAAARAREQSLLHRPPSASRMLAMNVDAPSGRADKRPNEVPLAGIALTHDSGSASSAATEVAQSACDNWCVVDMHQGAADEAGGWTQFPMSIKHTSSRALAAAARFLLHPWACIAYTVCATFGVASTAARRFPSKNSTCTLPR
jgi:hypothetical protein